ncbi:MAG: hypothetical protein ACI976_000483 [Aureispira sp.]|jgi:hypothetical protein
MIIEKRKGNEYPKLKHLNLLLWFIVLSSCVIPKNDKKVMTIYSSVKIDKTLYKYSKESSLGISGNYYSLRQEAIYDEHGNLQKVISYKLKSRNYSYGYDKC